MLGQNYQDLAENAFLETIYINQWNQRNFSWETTIILHLASTVPVRSDKKVRETKIVLPETRRHEHNPQTTIREQKFANLAGTKYPEVLVTSTDGLLSIELVRAWYGGYMRISLMSYSVFWRRVQRYSIIRTLYKQARIAAGTVPLGCIVVP